MIKKHRCKYCGKTMAVVSRQQINEEISKVGVACNVHRGIVYNRLVVTKRKEPLTGEEL